MFLLKGYDEVVGLLVEEDDRESETHCRDFG